MPKRKPQPPELRRRAWQHVDQWLIDVLKAWDLLPWNLTVSWWPLPGATTQDMQRLARYRREQDRLREKLAAIRVHALRIDAETLIFEAGRWKSRIKVTPEQALIWRRTPAGWAWTEMSYRSFRWAHQLAATMADQQRRQAA